MALRPIFRPYIDTICQFVFDFLNATTGVSSGAGGRAVGASVSNFPALVGQGVAMTVGFLGTSRSPLGNLGSYSLRPTFLSCPQAHAV